MSNARKILVVDGDPVARKSFEQALSGKGYAVTTTSNGEDALWQLGNGRFDAVFAEIALRGISGLDLAEETRVRQPSVQVVIISADASGGAKERATAAGAVEFLKKPLSPEQLADTAERLVPLSMSDAGSQTAAAEDVAEQTLSRPLLRLKNVVLFLAAPFVGLAYLLAFPVFALGMALWMALKQSEESAAVHPAVPAARSMLKTIAMIPAALVVGIFYAVIGPILGIGVVVWFGFQAWAKAGVKAIT